MLRTKLTRSFAALVGAFLIASCSDSIINGPTAPANAVASHDNGSNSGSVGSLTGSLVGGVTDAAGLDLRAVWWSKKHKTLVRVSKTIDQSGGTISIPETGLTIEFPAGALSKALTITVTADEKYVAYKMEPSGTQFLKDVTVTQSLRTTAVFGTPLKSQLYAAYIADDNVKLSGNKIPVLEIEPSKTIFSPLSALVPEAQVWIIRHFSRYMLASG
jgi:hypothetical protein